MSTVLKLDHLVYAVPNLTDAIDSFEEQLGQAPTHGGRHEGLGTHNAILPLANECYVELIASDPDGRQPSHPRPFGLDSLEGARLVTWAVRSHAIEKDVERVRTRGFDPGAILEMSRRSPTGEILKWKLALQAKPVGDGIVPFVIDWGRTPHPAATGTGPPLELELESLTGGHPNRESLRPALDALNVRLELEVLTQPSLRAVIQGPRGRLTLT